VLLDVRLGEESGFDLARSLLRERPETAVLLVSANEEVLWPGAVGECGARAGVLKACLADADLDRLWGYRRWCG
jgi:DNA-binding NarL/FixJ family response regulator